MADRVTRSATRVTGFADPELDFQLMRQLGAASYGGASVGEVLGLVPLISSPADWVDRFAMLARRQRADAEARARRGHHVSAREGLLRAANSFRAAEYFAPFGGERHRQLGLASHDAFVSAMAFADHVFEDVGYDFEGKRMPAYWLRPAGDAEPGPTVLIMSGFDGTLEEIYFGGGLAALERGWRVLLFAGPGQMDTTRTHPELPFVPDAERWVSSALDEVLVRPEVAPQRVSLVGLSFGGYFAARAAAHEPRVRALVANSPIVDLRRYLVSFSGWDPETLPDEDDFGVDDIAGIPDEEFPPPFKEMSRMMILRFGQPTMKATFRRLRDFVVDDLSAIRCPSLALVGEGEGKEPASQLEAFERGVSGPVTTHVFTAEEGADTHCQVGNASLAAGTTFDWLDETLS